MELGDLSIKILLNLGKSQEQAKELTADLKGIEVQEEKTGAATVKMESSLANFGMKMQGIQQIIQLFHSTFGELIKDFQESEIAGAKLEQGLKNIGNVDSFIKLKEQAESLQKTTIFNHSEIENAQAILTTEG